MNNNEIFELVLQSKLFDRFEQKLSEDDYNDLLNEITLILTDNI